MPTTLVLVRHGESRCGVAGVLGGHRGCTGLTERGREQATRLRDRFARTREFTPSAVLSSNLPRAVETADVVHEAFSGVERVRDCAYCEVRPGADDGELVRDLEAKYGDVWHDPPADLVRSPGAESPRAFDTRVRRSIAGVLETYPDQTVLLVSHGMFITAATLFLMASPGVHEVGPFWIDPKHTSLTVLGSGGPENRWVLDRTNDVAHLGEG